MHTPIALVLAALIAGSALPALAHEFWISPNVYMVQPGDTITAELRVGQMFSGASRSYRPDDFVTFEAGAPEDLAPVEGRLGDRPALSAAAGSPGLWLAVHETTDRLLTYTDWEIFENFVAMHDLGDAPEAHLAKGFPQTGFRESYRRFGKSLVAVGDGAGADRRLGLEVEIVAETNPYTLPPGAPMQVRMYENGAPRADAQLEMFVRSSGETADVARAEFRSDAEGLVTLPVVPGSEVMLNFVTLYPQDGAVAAGEPVWRSHWASLTYAVPAAE